MHSDSPEYWFDFDAASSKTGGFSEIPTDSLSEEVVLNKQSNGFMKRRSHSISMLFAAESDDCGPESGPSFNTLNVQEEVFPIHYEDHVPYNTRRVMLDDLSPISCVSYAPTPEFTNSTLSSLNSTPATSEDDLALSSSPSLPEDAFMERPGFSGRSQGHEVDHFIEGGTDIHTRSFLDSPSCLSPVGLPSLSTAPELYPPMDYSRSPSPVDSSHSSRSRDSSPSPVSPSALSSSSPLSSPPTSVRDMSPSITEDEDDEPQQPQRPFRRAVLRPAPSTRVISPPSSPELRHSSRLVQQPPMTYNADAISDDEGQGPSHAFETSKRKREEDDYNDDSCTSGDDSDDDFSAFELPTRPVKRPRSAGRGSNTPHRDGEFKKGSRGGNRRGRGRKGHHTERAFSGRRGSGRYVCTRERGDGRQCGESCTRAADLVRHIFTVHDRGKVETLSEEDKAKLYEVTDPRERIWCEYCRKILSRVDARKRHEANPRACSEFPSPPEEDGEEKGKAGPEERKNGRRPKPRRAARR
ncbi:hypothetical protein GLOTRDRAFT_128293 [Gloeophyllum trabeum ATCC 11539]|uniref:C2H2-type domain-containing protein n=1 Tax=Gloeophyllum trabeum (strain ATCC 11539 / FP-39264 / Madison 617) TaxID=670483 RepID=S7QAE4_GLOTA|nr:uncharacterized protein GLOTRDRAFT_128293 [Gloeophyllum trabeum ATCC 11539]EPQ56348.1 hypothetical protein GLOTRDRAFT_128293 [Gloeophyllum trabeum ATCC 11539]